MPRTTGLIHHNADLSRHGQQMVFAADGNLLANVGSFRRNDAEDLANAERVVECWNACAGMQQPQVAVQWAREAIAKVLDNISDLDDDARDQITEETFRALETADSALGKA